MTPRLSGISTRQSSDSKRTFRRFEVDLDPIELLHDVIQGIKVAYFERMRAFDDQRDALADIPANFCFVSGIQDAKDRIRTLFTAEGFLVAPDADYAAAHYHGDIVRPEYTVNTAIWR